MTTEMMSTKEVAEYLNINEKQVYKLIKEKAIPASRATGKWTFPKKLIDEWIIKNAAEHAGMRSVAGAPENHIVVMGSNDFTLEILSQELTRRHPDYSLSISNVGSAEGLAALGKRICHLACAHLLDPKTGAYNLPFYPRYLPDLPVLTVNMVYRDVGLIVAKDNPKNIAGIQDLASADITIINRQQGSGTRALLDRELQRLGLQPSMLRGYHNEVTTHLQAALAVLSGAADAAVAILPAAALLHLDFIHMAKERYDLILPKGYMRSKPVEAVLSIVRSAEFKTVVDKMVGYDTSHTGEIMTK